MKKKCHDIISNNLAKKYNIVIHTMAKNEHHILNEWITHHILLGVEHIFIYDDFSKYPISEKIKELPSFISEKVTVFRLDCEFNEMNKHSKYYHHQFSNIYKKDKQLYYIHYFLERYTHVSTWCFFCDVDEFIYLKGDANIHDFLNQYNHYNSLVIPWLVYGSSFHINQPDGLVMEHFRYHDRSYFHLGKCIVKMTHFDKIVSHHILYKNKNNIFVFDKKKQLFDLPIHITPTKKKNETNIL
jgi:hypothetical protein